MKKTILLTSLMLVAVVGLTGCGNKNSDDLNDATDKQSNNDSELFSGKLADLIKKGKSFKCTTDMKDSGFSSVYYIDSKNEKTRAEMKMKMPMNDKITTTFMIADKEFSYTWKEGDTKGMKISIDEEESTDYDDVDLDDDMLISDNPMEDEMNLNCKAWKVDKKMFNIPADIEFQDLSKMMETFAPENTENMNMEDLEDMMKDFDMDMGL